MNLDQRIGLVERTPKGKLSAVEINLDANRDCPRWQRIRAACCEHHGLPMTLDEHSDRIWLVVTGNETRGGANPHQKMRAVPQKGA